MSVTMPAIDEQVLEIMSEPSRCQIPHKRMVCGVTAAAIADYVCDPGPLLACKPYADYMVDAMSDPSAGCEDCLRPICWCWSVVMLP